MKNIPIFLISLLVPVFANASDCALTFDEGLAAVLSQEGTLESVACERNVIADLDITVIFRCASGAESPLIAYVDRVQGQASCGVQWFDCNGNADGYQTPAPISGKSASADFAAIRGACNDLL